MKIRIELGEVKPNASIGANYRAKLRKMIVEMVKDSKKEITNAYSQRYDFNDPVEEMKRRIAAVMTKWQMYYDMSANSVASQFVDQIDTNVDSQIKNDAKKFDKQIANQFYVKFSESSQKALISKKAAITQNVNLIKSIPRKYHTDIETAVMEAMQAGADYRYLERELIRIGGVTDKRAKFIARDQLFKATEAINTEKRDNLGIKKSIWHHSKGDKEPRKYHLEADGQEYETAKGCPIKDEKTGIVEYIHPKQKIGCTCWSSAYLEFD